MLTVLPTAHRGVSYGVLVLEGLVGQHNNSVVAIIQIGGDADELRPTSVATFIVLMIDTNFSFTAFVSDRGTMPETKKSSGSGSYHYNKFRKFSLEFIDEAQQKGANERGLRPMYMEFHWGAFFDSISEDFGYTYENVSELEKAFNSQPLGDWTVNKTMEAYRCFLINSVFTELYKIISPYSDSDD